MHKRLFIVLLLMTIFCIPAKSVLKEKDLSQTLSILRDELVSYYHDQQEMTLLVKKRNEQMRNDMIQTMQRSNENALMLYSQKSDYIFDLTYACHEATEQYNEYAKNRLPFDQVINTIDVEINRYEGLRTSLKNMPTMLLSDKSKVDRNVCLTVATAIYNQLIESKEGFKDDVDRYNRIGSKLKVLHDYAQKRYNMIQQSIFVNGGENYPTIISRFGYHLAQTQASISEKYRPTGKTHSQWRGPIVFGLFMIILFYGMMSVILNLLFVRFVMPKKWKTDDFLAKRPCIIMASTVITFAVIIGIIRATVNQNFIIMASDLLVEYTWLLGVILISLLVRLESSQIKSGFRIYSPIITMGFIVIAFRIILIPNELVNIFFPPILLICSLWQWSVIKRHNKNVPQSDIFYTWVTLAIFITSVICSWWGYTLLSVQLLIWWIMQLTCIQTITCMYDWLKLYENKHFSENTPVTKTWMFNLFSHVMLPSMGVFSVLLSFYWAADVFDLSDICWKIFSTDFVNKDNFSLSILRLSIVMSAWFLFKYFAKTGKALLKVRFSEKDYADAMSRQVMGKNILNITVWGFYIILTMNTLNVGNTWLLVITGGLSTGIGFASKDILENIYYGISLMTGRVHIGDYIECDGTRGVVSSISYTSTMIEAIDGSVIAFQNSQLFTKNYKNLTRNHGYELVQIPVGIAYGCNVNKVREFLKEELNNIDCYDKSRGLSVVFDDFGDNSINLKIIVWVNVARKAGSLSKIKETIYNTLNSHNIEMPFPQRDIYIKEMPKEQ
jgi:potassium-dependent mechanosensitive channel